MMTGEQARERRIQELQAAWEGEAATAATEEERRLMQEHLAGYLQYFAAQTESWWKEKASCTGDIWDFMDLVDTEHFRQTGEHLLPVA